MITGLYLLSYLDSNQDKLIQSQMCYRYTIGQTSLPLLKAGAKVRTFLLLAKFFLSKKLFQLTIIALQTVASLA